ncbi:hypothetical protein EBZ39_10905 [bacterium]|nr:hypothetical protein [bacterium]
MKKTKNRKFEMVRPGNMVSFIDTDKKINNAVVIRVDENTFTVSIPKVVIRENFHGFLFLDRKFYKTGTKTHRNHTNGNAIEITSDF